MTNDVELFATFALGEMQYAPALEVLMSRAGCNGAIEEETERSILKIKAAAPAVTPGITSPPAKAADKRA
jgi:hypothetical protein